MRVPLPATARLAGEAATHVIVWWVPLASIKKIKYNIFFITNIYENEYFRRRY